MSLVEMTQRHIREGEERIARQKQLMDGLARDGRPGRPAITVAGRGCAGIKPPLWAEA
jgi:hypothetical protein